jgi:hypothetical protein
MKFPIRKDNTPKLENYISFSEANVMASPAGHICEFWLMVVRLSCLILNLSARKMKIKYTREKLFN